MNPQILLNNKAHRLRLIIRLRLISTLILSALIYNCKSQDISQELVSNTIKIEGFTDIAMKHRTSGSGFFFLFSIGKDSIPVIVTNKHVIENCLIGILKFNTRLGNKVNYGNIVTVTLHNFNTLWIKDPDEDLAILPMVPILKKAELQNLQLYTINFTEDRILTKENENEFNAIEDVYMLGYPKGLSDTINNLPIARKGITATPTFINYNGKDHILLDIPTYTGSSGSPVVQYKESGYSNKHGSFIVGQPLLYLIGIAVEEREYAAKGETQKINGKKIETTTWLPFGIAEIIKAYKLFDLKRILEKQLNSPDLPNKIIKNMTLFYSASK